MSINEEISQHIENVEHSIMQLSELNKKSMSLKKMTGNNSQLRCKRDNNGMQWVNPDGTLIEGIQHKGYSWDNWGIGNMDWILQDIMELLLTLLDMCIVVLQDSLYILKTCTLRHVHS